ncbi:MAG: MFS transporter [Pseudonocardiaceae bacterium]
MRAVFRLRDFRLLFAGLAASMVGDALMVLVFAIWAKRLTGSSSAAGLVMLFIAVPYAVSPLGGWLIDRFRRRPFLVVVNLASALTLLPLFAVRNASDVWIIYLVALLYGVSSVTIAAALNGLLKELLTDDLLATANGALQTVKEGLRLGGPLAGAALFATLGGPTVAAIDAVSFLAAAAAIARMRLSEEPAKPTTVRWSNELTTGLSLIRTEPALRRTMTAGAIAFLVIGLNESIFFALVDQGLHRPPEFIGVLASAQGVGAIAGGLLVARLITRSGELAATATGLAAFGLGDGLCIFAWLPSVLAGRILSGFGLSVMFVGLTTVIQRRTPAPLLGRVSLAAETLTSGPQTISIAAGAMLVSVVNYRLLFAMVTAGMLIGATYLWNGRRLTRPLQRTNPSATTSDASTP